jgi:hypothetical protein
MTAATTHSTTENGDHCPRSLGRFGRWKRFELTHLASARHEEEGCVGEGGCPTSLQERQPNDDDHGPPSGTSLLRRRINLGTRIQTSEQFLARRLNDPPCDSPLWSRLDFGSSVLDSPRAPKTRPCPALRRPYRAWALVAGRRSNPDSAALLAPVGASS